MATTEEPRDRPAPASTARSATSVLGLPGPQRTVAVTVLALVSLVPVVVAVLVLVDGWRLLGERAILGFHVQRLLDGDLPLVGPPAVGRDLGSGVAVSQPGPAPLYVLAPFVALLGPSVGAVVGAALVNSLALLAAVWAGFRRGGLLLAGLAAAVLVLVARALGPSVLADPTSSGLALLPTITFALLAWAVLVGDRRLLPVAVVAGSFALQADLALLGPIVAVAGVLTVGSVAQRRAGDAEPFGSRVLVQAGVAGIVLWAPVLADQVGGSGNLSSIVRTVASSEGGAGLAHGLDRLWLALGAPPLALVPVADGPGLADPTALSSATAVLVLAVLVVLAFVPVGGRVLHRTLQPFVAVVVAVAVVSTALAVRVPLVDVADESNLRWMIVLSALAWLGATWGLIRAALVARPEHLERLAPVTMTVLVAVVGLVGATAWSRAVPDAELVPAGDLVADVADEVPPGAYRVAFADDRAAATVGPTFALELAAAGSDVFVDAGPGRSARAFGDASTYRGQDVDGSYLVLVGDGQLPPDHVEVARGSAPDLDVAAVSVPVVLAYQVGRPPPAPDPTFCELIFDVRDSLTGNLGDDAQTWGSAADAIEGLDLSIDDDVPAPPGFVEAVRSIDDRLDELVAWLREDPSRLVDDETGELLAVEFPDLALDLVTALSAADPCLADDG